MKFLLVIIVDSMKDFLVGCFLRNNKLVLGFLLVLVLQSFLLVLVLQMLIFVSFPFLSLESPFMFKFGYPLMTFLLCLGGPNLFLNNFGTYVKQLYKHLKVTDGSFNVVQGCFSLAFLPSVDHCPVTV